MTRRDDAAFEGPLDLFAQGRLSLPMAAMRAVLDSHDDAALAGALAAAGARWGDGVLAPLRARLDADAVAFVRTVAAALDHTFQDPAPEAVLARLAAGFDVAAAVSADAGVALYALGDPALLAAATAEVVDWLRAEGLFRTDMRVLDVGCGAGRFLRALAAEAAVALGVEISPGMAAEAARRLADASHVAVVRGTGRHLAFVADASVDLVLFADSFPYAVQAGGSVQRDLLRDAARALRPDGRVVILNWSYRGDDARDARERAVLLPQCGLVERAHIAAPFRSWDATATVLAPAP